MVELATRAAATAGRRATDGRRRPAATAREPGSGASTSTSSRSAWRGRAGLARGARGRSATAVRDEHRGSPSAPCCASRRSACRVPCRRPAATLAQAARGSRRDHAPAHRRTRGRRTSRRDDGRPAATARDPPARPSSAAGSSRCHGSRPPTPRTSKHPLGDAGARSAPTRSPRTPGSADGAGPRTARAAGHALREAEVLGRPSAGAPGRTGPAPARTALGRPRTLGWRPGRRGRLAGPAGRTVNPRRAARGPARRRVDRARAEPRGDHGHRVPVRPAGRLRHPRRSCWPFRRWSGEPWTVGGLNRVLLETLDLLRLRAVDPARLGDARTTCRRPTSRSTSMATRCPPTSTC